MTMKNKGSSIYPRHILETLEPYYSQHVSAMTTEELHHKSDIAEQLAWRDQKIAELDHELNHDAKYELEQAREERDKAREMVKQCAKTRAEYQDERDEARARVIELEAEVAQLVRLAAAVAG